MQAVAQKSLSEQRKYTVAVNQRFKGGYITRAYGSPEEGMHALQLELTQRTYMDESHPFAYQPKRAGEIQPVLRKLLAALLEWAEDQ